MGNSHATGTDGGGRLTSYAQSVRDAAASAPGTINKLAAGLNQTAAATQNLSSAVQANVNVYQQAQQQLAKTGGGGYGSCGAGYFGGDAEGEPSKALKEYRESLAAATKDRIIRGLARALRRADIDVNPDASAEEIARALESKLPNPRKGKTFAADAKSQEKVCRTVADVLNDEFTPGAKKADRLIDTSLGPVSVCRQVAEIVHSLSTGLHTEFLEVHASLTRILRNLEVLNEALTQLHANIVAQVGDCETAIGADKKVADFNEVYSRVQRERERQMAMLRNFLSVTLAPAQEELAIAMRDEGETHDMIQRLKLVPGTGEFADSLASAVSGLGTVAAVSARVDKALREVGLSVQEYLKSGGIDDLEAALDTKLMASGDVKADDVGNFLLAVRTLKENFYRRDELDFGGASDAELAAEIAGAYEGGGRHGGAESTLDKRVKKRKLEKKVIVKEFIDKSTRQYDALLKAIQVLGPELGKTVPLSDGLEKLRNALARLSTVNLGALSLELSLIGYYGNAEAREQKETFLAGLRLIQRIIDDLMGMEMYRGSSHHFAAMRAAIDGLVRTIDFYSDVVAKKYGSGDGDGDLDDEVTGGDLSALPEVARSAYDLDRAVNTFLYFYYVAKVRANLAQTHKELEYYGEKYVDILGDAVAARLRQLETQKAADLKAIEDRVRTGTSLTPAAVDAVKAAAKAFVEKEYSCKANFYRALQALDLYMKAFTDGIVAHPDDVADVKRMVDGVTVIGRWFVEETGDDLAAAFDMMPGVDAGANIGGGARVDVDITADAAGAPRSGHYYEKLAASTATNNLLTPGVPQLAVSPSRGAEVQKQVSKVFDNFQALKNITNAFVRVGDKFGGKELRRQVFMSPTQMYKAFLEYMKCSALSIGVNGTPAVSLTDSGGTTVNAPAVGNVRGTPAEEQVYFGSALDDLGGNYVVEDGYFSFCVKAMAAKVLTVIGVYDLFERPSPVYDLTPTRMIIGGGSDFDAIPEVIPEASELYFRLPRLAEFYKDLFDWGGAPAQISMLPEIEGVFSGLIRLIFNRVQGGAAASGDYSDLEVRAIVREVNGIYENFKGGAKGSAISEALSAFVMEINRRYGLVKKDDWDKMQALLSESRRAVGGPSGTNTNYAILPGEEEYESVRRAPSDRYLGPGAAGPAASPLSGEHKIDGYANGWGQWQMLKSFREKLDAKFASVSPSDFTTYSFSTVIRQGELEMRRAEGASAKIGVAARLIQGSGNLAGVDVGKTFMFHETVVVGLNTLSAVYTLLAAFRAKVVATDLDAIRNAITAWAKGLATPPGNGSAVAAAVGALGQLPPGAGQYVLGVADSLQQRGSAPPGAANLLYGAFSAAATAATPVADSVAEALATYAVDSRAIMRDLLTVINGVTTTFQGLVTARFPGTAAGQIHLDFSGLRGLIQGLMSDVRYFMDLLRPHISKTVMQRYEDRANPGSLYWLEENLLDGLVRGLPDDASQPAASRTKTFEWMSRTLNRTYSLLVGYNRYTISGIGTAGPLVPVDRGTAPVDPAASPQNYEQYGALLCGRVFYDATADANSGVTAGAKALGGSGLDALVSLARPRPPAPGAAPAQVPAPTGTGVADNRTGLWDDTQGGLLDDRSLLFCFNQLLAKYVSVFYDAASGKIYRSLIDGFANGSFSRAVMTRGHSLPDLVTGNTAFGLRGDPTGSGVLCESLALVLQRLMTDINPATQISDHLVATLSEIPLYIRESFRANLPAFVKLFELVQKEGELIKQLMAQTTIQCGRPYGPSAAAATAFGAALGGGEKIVLGAGSAVADAAPGPYTTGSTTRSINPIAVAPTDSAGVKVVIAGVIDGIAAGCYSISNAAAEVLRELADDPLYLQTHENSIQEYKARYGKMPLMPISTVLTYLQDMNVGAGTGAALVSNNDRLFPEHSVGDQAFKLMYGTRKMLGRPTSKFTLGDAPGIRANLEAFNASAAGGEKVDSARLEEFLGRTVAAVRFLVDVRHYRTLLTPGADSVVLRVNFTDAGGAPSGTVGIITAGNDANAAYSLRVTPQNALTVTESSYQEQELKKISDIVGGSGVALGQDRTREWVFNIIDMNIVPINVHALMRGIPLAPLYNYVYTFEQMACLMLGETASRVESQATPVNTRQMMLKLMMHPYMRVSDDMYGANAGIDRYGADGLIARIFRGDDSLMMGRPKFLSDQVYNKALFGTLVPTPYSFDESGPPGSGRMEAFSPAAVNNPVLATPGIGLVPAGSTATWGGPRGSTRQAIAVGAVRRPASSTRGASYGYAALTYLARPNDTGASSALKQVQIGSNAVNKIRHLDAVGKARFDTRIVRNLVFITNVQRLMRLKLNQELTQYRNVLVSNHSVVNPGVTEYGYLPPASLEDPRHRKYGPANETAADRRYDNETRLVH